MSIHLSVRLIMIVLLVVLFGLVFTRRRASAWGAGRRKRHEPPPLPRRHPPPTEPSVRIGRLLIAIFLFPFVLIFWAIASLGDLVEGAVHVVLAGMSFVFALLGSFFGGRAGPQWRSTWREAHRALMCVYNAGRRFVEYVGFGGFLKKVENDIRDARELDRAPGGPPRQPVVKPGTFPFEDRYRIESNLAGGGSTAHLFVVRRLQRDRPVGDRLVLKYFDMGLGSRLEEVMRESRGMQVAREMGIVLDHDLGPDHFYYTMPYYEGETLTRAAARIHRRMLSGQGMEKEDIETCLGWVSEVLRILDAYHRRGVIHKDVKPDNLIVTDEGIRLVDLGLLTPVESALTLTTHGTEYFRDPEMVKLAVAGKRVRDVDAARFDIYSAGAVTYLLLEGSFPACGPLSRFSRPVPMALSTITSRAMAEGGKRYPSIAAMRADLDAFREMLRDQSPDEIPLSAMPSFHGFEAAESGVPEPPPMPDLPVREEPVLSAAPQPMRIHLEDLEPPRPRRRARFVAVMLGALLALAGVAALLWRVEAPSDVLPYEDGSRVMSIRSMDGGRVTAFVSREIESALAREPMRAYGETPIILAAAAARSESPAIDALVRDAERALREAGKTIHADASLAGSLEQWLLEEPRSATEVLWWLKPRIGAVPACVLWFSGGSVGSRMKMFFLGEVDILYGPVSAALAAGGRDGRTVARAPFPTSSSRPLTARAATDFLISTISGRRDQARTDGLQVPAEPRILVVTEENERVEALATDVRTILKAAGFTVIEDAHLAARVRAHLTAPRSTGVETLTFPRRMAELDRLTKSQIEEIEPPAIVHVYRQGGGAVAHVVFYWNGLRWLHYGPLVPESGGGE